jgi:hypothetical protein
VPSLRELQLSFATALLDGSGAALAPWIRGAGLDSTTRINIYRNNLREGFLKALGLGFPVIQRLVGEQYFRQLGTRFLSEHPSRAGNLHHIGAPFPEFLRGQFGETPYAYLPDMAELEWAYQEVLIAPEAFLLDLTPLRAIPPEKLADVCFDVHPACKLVSSQFPIVRIWRANQDDRDGSEIIDLAEGADLVLVRRDAEAVELRRLPPAEFAMLRAMFRGATLGDALQAAQVLAADFDLPRALRHFVGLNVFASFKAP